jgi:hypothetical protein
MVGGSECRSEGEKFWHREMIVNAFFMRLDEAGDVGVSVYDYTETSQRP